MAQLSEADKKRIFGENYQEVEKAAELAGTQTALGRMADALRSNCQQVRGYGLVVSCIAAIITVTNYFQVSGPYQRSLGIAATAAVVIGVVCASLAQITLSRSS